MITSTTLSRPNRGFNTSPEKEMLRKQIMDTCRVPVRDILTMSGPNFKDARLWVNHPTKPRVLSIETKERTFRKQCREMAPITNIRPQHISLFDFLKNGHMEANTPFQILFLDFFGPYSKRIEEDLEILFSKRLQKGAILALTLLKGRDGEKALEETHLLKTTCCGDYEEYKRNRLNAISSTIESIAASQGKELSYGQCGLGKTCADIEPYEYQNHGKGAVMMFFLFRITKN